MIEELETATLAGDFGTIDILLFFSQPATVLTTEAEPYR